MNMTIDEAIQIVNEERCYCGLTVECEFCQAAKMLAVDVQDLRDEAADLRQQLAHAE